MENEEESEEIKEDKNEIQEKNEIVDETPSVIDIETYNKFNNGKNEEQINAEEETTLEQICKKFKENNICP